MSRNGKKSLLRNYWITFCCFAMIPMLILLLAVNFFIDEANKNAVKEQYRRSVAQTANHLDSIVQDMEAQVESLNYVLRETNPQHTIINYLFTLEQNSRIPEKLLYYPIGGTTIASAQRILPYTDLTDEIGGDISLEKSQFFTNINALTSMKIWLLKQETGRFSSTAAFGFPVFNGTSRRSGTLIFLIDTNDLLRVVSEYLGIAPDHFYLYSANLKDSIIVSEPNDTDDTLRSRLIRSKTGIVTEEITGNDRFGILHYKSDIYGLQIAARVNLRSLAGHVREPAPTLIYIVILLAILILGFSTLLAWHFYRPIRTLIASTDSDEEEEEGMDEISRLNRRVNTMHTDIGEMRSRLETQRPMLREWMIRSLLRGAVSADDRVRPEDVCPELTNEKNTFVILVTDETRKLQTYYHMLEEIHLMNCTGLGTFMDQEQMFAIIMTCPKEQGMREAICGELNGIVRRMGIENALLSAGGMKHGLADLPTSFIEAYVAMENGKSSGNAAPYLYSDISIEKASEYLHEPSQPENRQLYLQSLRSVNKGTALSLLDRVLQEIDDSSTSVLMTGYARLELYIRAKNCIENDPGQKSDTPQDVITLITDRNAFRNLMVQLTDDCCASADEKRDAQYAAEQRKILDLIREHCFEPDFSLSQLSEFCGRSPTYVNRCLKDTTGSSYLQYVSILRMNRAGELLSTTDYKVKEIVEMIGYQDVASFSRKFKEYEGVTPIHYREIYRENTPVSEEE